MAIDYLANEPVDYMGPDPNGPLPIPSRSLSGVLKPAVAPAPPSPYQQMMDLINSNYGENKKSSNLADISSLLGSFSSGAKADRALQGGATQNFDQTALAAQAGRNSTESVALRKLTLTNYLLNSKAPAGPASVQMNGQSRQLPTFTPPSLAPSDTQKTGASTLQDQLLKRLAPGGTVAPSPISTYGGTPSTMEKIGSYGALGTGAMSMINSLLHPDDGSGDTSSGSSTPGVGSQLGSLAMKGIKKLPGLFSKLGHLF